MSEEHTDQELIAPASIGRPIPPNAFDAARLDAVIRKQLRGLIERMIERGLFFSGLLLLTLSIAGYPHYPSDSKQNFIIFLIWSVGILYLGGWVISPITELNLSLWDASSIEEREEPFYLQYCGVKETLKGCLVCGVVVIALVAVTFLCGSK